METLNPLQSVAAIHVGGLALRVHPDTVTQLTKAFPPEQLKGLFVEYWGNWYIRINKISPEIGHGLTQVTLPTDPEE